MLFLYIMYICSFFGVPDVQLVKAFNNARKKTGKPLMRQTELVYFNGMVVFILNDRVHFQLGGRDMCIV